MFGFGKKKNPELPKTTPQTHPQPSAGEQDHFVSQHGDNAELAKQNLVHPHPNAQPGEQAPLPGPAPEKEKKGFFSKVGDVMGKGYDATKKGVSNLAGKAKEGFGVIKDKTAEVGDKLAENKFVKKYGIDVYEEAKQKLVEIKNDLKEEIVNNQYFKNIKFKVNRYLVLKLEKIIDKQLAGLAKKLQKGTDDPDMPGCVQRLKNDLIEEFYPDLKDEIMFMLKMEVHQPYLDLEDPPRLCCLFQGLRAFRAWVLYTLDPVDMSIWKRMKTVSFWLLQVVQNFPLYGVQTFFLLFYFLLMCKTDEYQLVNYIVSFKKMQFFTIGCLGGLIAYVQYFFCITTNGGIVKYYDVNRCAAKTDDDPITYWIEIGTFFLKILLVWLCYLLLPCSSKLGLPSFRIQNNTDKQEAEREKRRCFNCTRGGSRLRKLMFWELFASMLTVGLYLVLYFLVIKDDKVSMRESIYFCQTVYGLLSFPFLIFSVPMVTTLLCKTRDTKYDKFGRCVPDIPSLYQIKEKEKRRNEEIERKKRERASAQSKADDEQDFQSLLNDDGADFFDELDNEEQVTAAHSQQGKEMVASRSSQPDDEAGFGRPPRSIGNQ